MGKIIDISHHQVPAKIDYKKLCSQLDMAIIRVQYGSRQIDRHYKTHIAEMVKHGVPYGVYAWVRGVSVNDMQVEASNFYNRAKDYNPAFYVLDVEEQSMADMRVGINAYVSKLRALTDKKIGVYIAHHKYKTFNIDTRQFDFVWIPRYGKNDGTVDSQPAYPCDLYQYTDKGRLDGYSGNLDLNKLTGTKPLDFFIGTKTVNIDKLAQEVIAGKHGNGEARKKSLGANYGAVQAKVNKMYTAKPKENLKVDGRWGKETTKALQRHYKTTVDGVISGQPDNASTRNIPSATTKGSRGSMVIKAMQRDLGTAQDGKISYPSLMVKALQKRLGTVVDGKISKTSLVVKEMQRRLNKGTF